MNKYKFYQEIDNNLCRKSPMDFEISNENRLAGKTEKEIEIRKEMKRYKKSKQIKEKVENFLKKKNPKQEVKAEFQIQKHIDELKFLFPTVFGEEINEVWVHFDLDAFYASVEALYLPNINLIPIGIGTKYMLTTCNYEARKYGVKSGMPGFIALSLCPNLKILPNDMKKYKHHSEQVMTILTLFDKNIEIYGIDEAYICIRRENFEISKRFFNLPNDFIFSFKNIEILVNKIRQLVCEKTKLTISAGISVSRGLAKFCTSENKPNGQFGLSNNFHEFIKNKPVQKLNGIGSKDSEKLRESFGIKTIGELKEKLYLIFLVFPLKTFLRLFKLSFGFSIFDFKPETSKIKSVSNANSFKPTNDAEIILSKLFMISKTISQRLKNKKASSLNLFIKYHDYTSFNKQVKLSKSINSKFDIYENSLNVFKIFHPEIEKADFKKFNALIGHMSIKLFNLESQKNSMFEGKHINNHYLRKCFKCPICDINLFKKVDLSVTIHVNNCLDKQEILKPSNITTINNSKCIKTTINKSLIKNKSLNKKGEKGNKQNTLLKYFIKKN